MYKNADHVLEEIVDNDGTDNDFAYVLFLISWFDFLNFIVAKTLPFERLCI